MILFGHPTGNPNSHHAALAHYKAERLDAFCVPWFPAAYELRALNTAPFLRNEVARLRRRRLEELANAPKIQDRISEWQRLVRRRFGAEPEKLAYEANDWLMRTMAKAVRRPSVTHVHSYEDCSLLQFQQAKLLGKPCIYDMPIGLYQWWEQQQLKLCQLYSDWLPVGGQPSSRYVRPAQKSAEMELADLVLVACSFVGRTIRAHHPDKLIACAPYGVDAEFWSPWPVALPPPPSSRSSLRFIYAGQSSIRKGTPVLLDAWQKAKLHDAELLLVGSWQLAADKLRQLPPGVRHIHPVGPEKLRDLYRQSDIFLFPSFFEGFGLVILEAMACGLPVLASTHSAAPDILNSNCGWLLDPGDVEHLVERLRWLSSNRDLVSEMKPAARTTALRYSWSDYRKALDEGMRLLT